MTFYAQRKKRMKHASLFIASVAILTALACSVASIETFRTLWSKQYGGARSDYAYSTAVDSQGNSIMVGYFQSPTFVVNANITLTNSNTVSAVDTLFVIKSDAQGEVVFAKSFGGTKSTTAPKVAVDSNDNIIIGGYYYSASMVFDTFTITNADTSALSSDVFIVKLSSSGAVLWARSFGGNSLSL